LEADAKRRAARFATQVVDVVPDVSFDEAIEDLVSREPRLAASSEELAKLYSTEHVFGAVRSIDENMTSRIQKALADVMQRGGSMDDAVAVFREVAPWSRSYSETVYRTNLSTAYNAGRFEQASDPEVKDAIPALVFESMDDDRTRPNHKAADGLIAAADDPIWKRLHAPLGYNCFLPGTEVSGSFIGGLKAAYSGPVVEFKTSHGRSLTVTVNHPVLTERGWLPAYKLAEGDNCFSYGADGETFDVRNLPVVDVLSGRRAVDDNDAPSVIEDVFDSLWVQGIASSRPVVPMLPLDLHGDAKWVKGDVKVVAPDGCLLADSLDVPSEFASEFVNVHSSGDSSYPLDTLGRSDDRSLPPPASPRGGPSAFALTLDDGGIVGALFSQRPLEPLRFGPAADWNVTALEERRYDGAADPEFIGKLKDACAGKVTADKIVSIRKYEFSGHVYDLQSVTGWILSNCIVTSNCRCSVNFVSRLELERRGLIDANGNVTRYEPPGFSAAGPDPGFRPGGMEWGG
jgi:SPP1 gp7 family putative phage head morphogenesis protein